MTANSFQLRSLICAGIFLFQTPLVNADDLDRRDADNSTYIVKCGYSLKKWNPKLGLQVGQDIFQKFEDGWKLERKTVEKHGFENLGAYVWVASLNSFHGGPGQVPPKQVAVYLHAGNPGSTTQTGNGGQHISQWDSQFTKLRDFTFVKEEKDDRTVRFLDTGIFESLLLGMDVPTDKRAQGAWVGFDKSVVFVVEKGSPGSYQAGEISGSLEVFELRRRPVKPERAYACDTTQ
jgi:hypothetical protein